MPIRSMDHCLGGCESVHFGHSEKFKMAVTGPTLKTENLISAFRKLRNIFEKVRNRFSEIIN